MEIIFKPNGDQDRKRYIAGVAVETVHFGDNAIEDYREVHYLHRDHLGSLDAITDDQGALLQDLAFDAWGERRNPDTWGPYTEPQLIAFDHSATTRGFTGHEMLDEVGIIHMNGRIYDPKLGRFLQADPFVQEPTNTQSPNRYSYVINNPLNATDPSGYFFFSLIAAAVLFTAETLPAIEAIFGIMALAGFTDALVAGASFQDALLAGVSGGALSALGAAFLPAGGFADAFEAVAYAAKIGVVGGIGSVLQGARFGDGFRSAGISSLVGSVATGLAKGMDLKTVGQSVTRIVAGGTTSALTGGKFVNGASTAAFALAINAGLGKAQQGWARGVPEDPDESQAFDTALDVQTREYVDENGNTVRVVSYNGKVYGATGLEDVAIEEIEKRWNGSWVDESGVRYELKVDLGRALFGGDILLEVGTCGSSNYACADLGGFPSRAITITQDISIASDGMAFAHEFGHLIGFKHALTIGDVMSYDRDGTAGLRHAKQLWERNR